MNLSKEKTKDFIAGLIALIFVVSAGYLALNRFNDGETLDLGIGGQESAATVDAGTTDSMSYWIANDYSEGEIQTGSYTVVSGDTLWEIADAAYGDGSRWVDILNANADSIGFLSDGSQALIYAGQTLLLP